MHKIFVLINTLALINILNVSTAFGADQLPKNFVLRHCPSGRLVKIIDITTAKIDGSSKVGIILRYQSAYSNRQQMEQIVAEADDIWDQFVGDADRARVNQAIICAFYKPETSEAHQSSNKFISFTFQKDVHGKWTCLTEPRIGAGNPAKKAREETLAYIKNNDLSEALLACDKSIALDANYSPAYSDRAGLRLAFGHPEKAIPDCNLAIKLNPENGLAYAYRGTAYFQQGDTVHAVDDLTRAVQLRSANADVYHVRATALIKLGKVDLALSDLSDAIRLSPSNADLFRERAAVHDSLSKLDKEQAAKLSQNHKTH